MDGLFASLVQLTVLSGSVNILWLEPWCHTGGCIDSCSTEVLEALPFLRVRIPLRNDPVVLCDLDKPLP